MEHGPSVASLSAAQLRVIARIRSSRPTAEFNWRLDADGWALDVVQSTRGRPVRHVLTVHLQQDGTVQGTGTLL